MHIKERKKTTSTFYFLDSRFLHSSGFTLIEVIIAVTITAILAGVVTLANVGIKTQKDLDFSLQTVAAVVRDAQQRSITQEESKKWGVHLDTNTIQFYDLFKESHIAGNIIFKYTLPPRIQFDTASWGGLTKEIIFTSVDGLPTSDGSTVGQHGIIIQIANEPTTAKQITIAANGTITY